ncbi:hypothetical protein Tco_0538252 [Tanacetum coccineum]|uniref:Reverse transcriptase zinc-binding domain-containing protein n=1 Tax=Tanacetum coccineum TaxID=301880 RepID=A0ABQ5F6S5_9ASTR
MVSSSNQDDDVELNRLRWMTHFIKRKLKTQDRICSWDVSNSLAYTCPLCEAILDSHEHLFFMCPFSNDVWNHMKWLAGLDRVSHDIYAIIAYFDVNARRRSSHIVIANVMTYDG